MSPSASTVAARDLRAWLESSETSQRALADTLGVAQPTIAGWLAGRYLPSLALAANLQNASGGAVMAVDWTRMRRAARRKKGLHV